MGYARHIGRVGALAVTLGVGAAIANAPGIAYADKTGTSQNGDSSQKTTSSTPDTSSTTGQPTSPTDGAAADAGDLGSTTPDPKSQRRSVLRSVVVGAIRDIADIADGAVAAGNAAGATTRLGKQDSAGGDSANRQTSNISTTATRTRTRTITFDDAAENLQSTVNAVTQRVETTFQQLSTPGPNNTASTSLNTAAPRDICDGGNAAAATRPTPTHERRADHHGPSWRTAEASDIRRSDAAIAGADTDGDSAGGAR